MYLRNTLRQLKQEMANERRLMNDFQQQREQIEAFWTTAKQRRDDLKLILRNKLRQKQDLEEKHAFELKIYKQKVKHLLHEHQSTMADARYSNALALDFAETSQRDSEHNVQLEIRQLKVLKKEMETSNRDLLRMMRLEQDQRILAMRNEYERKALKLKEFYDQKMNALMTEMEEQRRIEIERVERKKGAFIQNIMAQHRRAFDDIKTYYRHLKHWAVEMIKSLKEDVAKLQMDDQQLQKEVQRMTRKNRLKAKPLKESLAMVAQLEQNLILHARNKDDLAEIQKSLAVLEERYKNLQWETEVTQQRFERVEQERNELRKRLEESVQDVRQKASFRNLVLERKVSATAQELEKTQAALAEVLASTSIEPKVAVELRHGLEDILMAKNKAIQRLEDELVHIKQRYAVALQLYEAKLREHNIPPDAIGFEPVRRV